MIYMTSEFEADAALLGPPLTHSRILWDNVLAAGTFTATAEDEGFEAERAQTTDTVSWWRPPAGATLTATFAAAEIDCIAIAAHSIGSDGVTATVQVFTGGAWQDAHAAITPGDDAAIMVAFRAVTATGVRVTLSGQARIGVLAAGKMLAMERQPTVDVLPLALIRATQYETNRSVTGQFMGRSRVSTSRPVSVTWPDLRRSWYEANFAPFVAAALEDPFFIALRPCRDASDIGYVLTSDDINPARSGLYLTVTLTGEAHVGPAE